jgi:hypothetical protein
MKYADDGCDSRGPGSKCGAMYARLGVHSNSCRGDARVSSKARRLFLAAAMCAMTIVVSVPARAACGGYYCTDTISQLTADSDGTWVLLTAGLAGLTNCTPNSGIFLRFLKTGNNYAAQHAILLAAKLADRTVTIRTVDGSNPCVAAYVYIE